MNKFKNRASELKNLEKLYADKAPRLLVMYGRRRVGKTSIMQEFLSRHKGIYLLARQETELENLKRFSEQIGSFFKDEILGLSPFQNWDSLFLYLAKKLKEERFIIAIDEFPYLAGANSAIPSILQDYWDNHFSKIDAFIIICGSSIAMMEKTLGYKSPLYGRRTEQILIEPLKFSNAAEFMPKTLGFEKKAEYYAILGGTPAYLMEFDFSESLEKNIIGNYLQKTKFLYQDVLFVLREELNEPRNYFAILRVIAKGKNSLNDIVMETGLERSLIGKYLSILIDMHLVERLLPITEKKSSRKGIYKIKDNFFRFWFRFVHEYENYIEQNRQELLVKEKIMPNLNSYVGGVFEDIAFQYLSESQEFRDYIFGRWWAKDTEIDIIGKSHKDVLLIEVKWKSVDENEALKIIEMIKEKSKKFPLKNMPLKFGIIAKKIENKEKLRKLGYLAFDSTEF